MLRMGLWSFLFGPRSSAAELGRLGEEAKHPHYGHVGEGSNLVSELHAQNVEKIRESERRAEEEAKDAAGSVPLRPGWNTASRRLLHRLQEERDIPRWYRNVRSVRKYLGKLEEAESRPEAYRLFQRARRISPSPGPLRKLERKLEKSADSLYRKFEGGEVGRGEFLRKRQSLTRSLRDLRRLRKW